MSSWAFPFLLDLSATHQISSCPFLPPPFLLSSSFQRSSSHGLLDGMCSPQVSLGLPSHAPSRSSFQRPNLTVALFASTLCGATNHNLKPKLLTGACKIPHRPVPTAHAQTFMHTHAYRNELTHTHTQPSWKRVLLSIKPSDDRSTGQLLDAQPHERPRPQNHPANSLRDS